MAFDRRFPSEIMRDILGAASDRARLEEIPRAIRLSPEACQKYLDILESRAFLRRGQEGCVELTDRGQAFLLDLRRATSYLRP